MPSSATPATRNQIGYTRVDARVFFYHAAAVNLHICALLCLATAATAGAADLDPCALVPQAEAAKIIGEIKEVKTSEGLRKEKQCDYTNMEGAWLKVSVQPADGWECKRGC